VRYQAALRPEPLGINTRTIASQQPSRSRLFFRRKIPAAALDLIIKTARWDFQAQPLEQIDQRATSA
jgi:hypothetical protein